METKDLLLMFSICLGSPQTFIPIVDDLEPISLLLGEQALLSPLTLDEPTWLNLAGVSILTGVFLGTEVIGGFCSVCQLGVLPPGFFFFFFV